MILFFIAAYFVVMVKLNFCASNWILDLLYQAGGVTKTEAEQYHRHQFIGRKKELYALYWLESRSRNPARVRRLAYLHNLSLLPSILCIVAFGIVFMLPLSSGVQNAILVAMMIFLPVYNTALAVAGIYYRQKAKGISHQNLGDLRYSDVFRKKDSEIAYPENLVQEDNEDVFDDEVFFPELAQEHRVAKRKRSFIVAAILFIVAAVHTLSFLWPQLAAAPKEPAEAEQVAKALIGLGYMPQDETETIGAQDPNLIQCLFVQEDDFFFEFYIYDNEDSACRIYESASSQNAMLFQEAAHAAHHLQKANYAFSSFETEEQESAFKRRISYLHTSP